jgi:hypothetical protein
VAYAFDVYQHFYSTKRNDPTPLPWQKNNELGEQEAMNKALVDYKFLAEGISYDNNLKNIYSNKHYLDLGGRNAAFFRSRARYGSHPAKNSQNGLDWTPCATH